MVFARGVIPSFPAAFRKPLSHTPQATPADFGQQTRHTDAHGNPLDEYGNPVQTTTGGTTGDYGSTGHQSLGSKIGEATGLGTGGHHGTILGHAAAGATGPGYGTTGYTTGATGTETGTGLSYGQVEHQEAGHGSAGDEFDVGGGFQNQPTATPIGGAGIGTGTGISTAGAETGTGGGMLHRSGSSSSSSSEDDGMGGRRKKKGVMQKIKEKLPGSHGDQQQTTHMTTTTTTGVGVGGTGYGETREKK
nr:hypothetical protein [Tanacetum cinerariifolium]